MRDLLVAAIFFGALPFVFSNPHIGVLLWSWIGYMNPHRLGWGFAYHFPFGLIVAVVTLISLVASRTLSSTAGSVSRGLPRLRTI